MAYIHKRTYDITVSVGGDGMEYDSMDGYFQADEMIALPVRALNLPVIKD